MRMGQAACAESICQTVPTSMSGAEQHGGQPKAIAEEEVTYCQSDRDSKQLDKVALPRLLGAKEDSGRSGDKSSPLKEDEVLGGIDLDAEVEAASSLLAEMPTADPLDAGHQHSKDSKALRKLERAEARKQVLPFLLQNGFHTVKSKKTFFWRSWYPLHAAVKYNDLETVRLLITAGADLQKLNSRGETPEQLAERLNRSGSHADILQALHHAKGKKKSSMKAKSSTASSLEFTPRGV
ncbi:Ctdspl2 [Symbiodinium natans]|uniref:Ctdspl2 protein n=1 Tax=Symbiodinium natans TaxID=878477 RepID=A0A812GPP4_9DINO|nr:Ctdspl2 [Symbiodinium natans]